MLNHVDLLRGILLIAVLLWGRVSVANNGPLEMSIEPIGGDHLHVTLTNSGTDRLSILKWDTPFEDVISADLFMIYLENGSVEKMLAYQGRLVKRAPVDRGDYFSLEAGESIQAVLPLSIYYEIPIRGQYRVEYTGSFHIETDASQRARQISRESKGGSVDLHYSLSPEPVTVELTPRPETRAVLPARFSSCTSQQQSELGVALQSSEDIALEAYRGLNSLQGDARLNSPRYKHWFGDFSAARYAKVLSTFSSTVDVLATQNVDFDCSCADSSLYAYVFRNQPYRIYPCPNFWAASLNGTDSRAGTIIHELTHFTAVSNTDDHEYGQVGASGLAVSDPDLAVLNADSYEYFAENTPAIEISNPLTFTAFAIDNAESGQLISGQSSYYKISDADTIELTSISGDADLYIYESAALDNVVCRSLSQNTLDVCGIDPLVAAYIEVRGYTDSEFSLIAQLRDPESLSSNKPVASSETEFQSVDDLVAVVTQSFGSGGNSGEAPADDQGGGATGWFLFLLLLGKRAFRLALYKKSRALTC